MTDPFGRVWELENLYVVGPAVLPTLGSPNPMLTGVALSRRTAEHLVATPSIPAADAGFEYLSTAPRRPSSAGAPPAPAASC